jgi:hypothetical protein
VLGKIGWVCGYVRVDREFEGHGKRNVTGLLHGAWATNISLNDGRVVFFFWIRASEDGTWAT